VPTGSINDARGVVGGAHVPPCGATIPHLGGMPYVVRGLCSKLGRDVELESVQGLGNTGVAKTPTFKPGGGCKPLCDANLIPSAAVSLAFDGADDTEALEGGREPPGGGGGGEGGREEAGAARCAPRPEPSSLARRLLANPRDKWMPLSSLACLRIARGPLSSPLLSLSLSSSLEM